MLKSARTFGRCIWFISDDSLIRNPGGLPGGTSLVNASNETDSFTIR